MNDLNICRKKCWLFTEIIIVLISGETRKIFKTYIYLGRLRADLSFQPLCSPVLNRLLAFNKIRKNKNSNLISLMEAFLSLGAYEQV